MIFNLSLDFYQKRSLFGLGLLPGVNQAADFLKQNKIKGPIFNNYDIGGYLIFHFFPKEKVFVDNRPEAYQIDFFEKIYKKSQSDLKSWEKLLQKYQFNVIIFSHRDYTSWGQNFLVNMIENQDFIPVFADDYNIIFLRRNKRNDFLIKKYQIAKERFKVVRD
jgi:c-di-AMP phosphodiesterase-like protein